MGGGGGGYSISSGDLDDLRRQVEERTRQTLATSEINALLGDELARINQRDIPKTSEYLDGIRDALGEDVEGFEKLLFGGSVSKHTYVDGLSDIDSLVVLKGEQLKGLSPAELRERFKTALQERLGAGDVADIRVGNLAVTVRYRDGIEIQLLPAVRHGDRIEISSADGQRWKSIEPQRFAARLTEVNQKQRGQVVPTIKLAKTMIDQLPEDSRLSGYHVEALAVAAFADYKGSTTPKDMLTRFFDAASEAVLRPAPDSTGQSRHIDEALGTSGSSERQRRARALAQIARRMEQSGSVRDWQQLMGS
ncbi:MAG TPA: CBASS oligonucleotide cyclase [Solirubrobacteraceae bacterium]|jgi:hypothetical protein